MLQIVALPEYYPYRTELHMLQKNIASILKHISPGSVLVELGCGSATKTSLIIDALLNRYVLYLVSVLACAINSAYDSRWLFIMNWWKGDVLESRHFCIEIVDLT